MTVEDALLSAVIAAPDDDTPRLVYADWLDENGQPDRAEFIRVQIELARLTADGQTNGELSARESRLRNLQKRQPWDRAGVLVSGNCEYRRGFVEFAMCQATTYLAAAEELFAITPMREVRVNEAERRLAEVSLIPRPATVRVQFESGRRHVRTLRQSLVELLNPDLHCLEDFVQEGRWVAVVWARWSGADRKAVENALHEVDTLGRAGIRLGLRPLNLMMGLGPLFPNIQEPFSTPHWLYLENGQLLDAHHGITLPASWLGTTA